MRGADTVLDGAYLVMRAVCTTVNTVCPGSFIAGVCFQTFAGVSAWTYLWSIYHYMCFVLKLLPEIWSVSNSQVNSSSLALLLFQQARWHRLYLKCYCQVILFLPVCQRSFNGGTVVSTDSLPLADVSFYGRKKKKYTHSVSFFMSF